MPQAKGSPMPDRHRHTGRPAFTLIELLVVVAIIGLLVALMLPALGKVRHSATFTRCQSNLRQIALAILTYESDHGRMPMHPFEAGDYECFPPVVKGLMLDARPLYEPYMNVDFFACPGVKPWKPSTSQALVISIDYVLTAGYYGDGRGDVRQFTFDNLWIRSDQPWKFNDDQLSVLAGDKAFRNPVGGIARFIVNHPGDSMHFEEWSPPGFAGSAHLAVGSLEDDLLRPTVNNFAYADGHVTLFGPGSDGLIPMPTRQASRLESSYLLPVVP